MAKFAVTQWAEVGRIPASEARRREVAEFLHKAGCGRPQSLDGAPLDELFDVTRRAAPPGRVKRGVSLKRGYDMMWAPTW